MKRRPRRRWRSTWNELCDRVAQQQVRDQQRAEKERLEALRQEEIEARREERRKKQLEVEAELEARRKEEAERAKKEEEKEYASRMRHMLKVRALEERRVVHLTLATSPPPTDASEPAPVHVKLTLPTNVTTVSRLADGITRLMTEYDYTNKAEHFKKGHRWMQLLDSIELGLQQHRRALRRALLLRLRRMGQGAVDRGERPVRVYAAWPLHSSVPLQRRHVRRLPSCLGRTGHLHSRNVTWSCRDNTRHLATRRRRLCANARVVPGRQMANLDLTLYRSGCARTQICASAPPTSRRSSPRVYDRRGPLMDETLTVFDMDEMGCRSTEASAY